MPGPLKSRQAGAVDVKQCTGEIEPAVPRKRSGENYLASFLKPRMMRSGKALLGVVMEAYVSGSRARKVDYLVSEFGIHMPNGPGLAHLPRARRPSRGLPHLTPTYRFPRAHWPELRSTNNIERVNKEIARRSDVVGIFPTIIRRYP